MKLWQGLLCSVSILAGCRNAPPRPTCSTGTQAQSPTPASSGLATPELTDDVPLADDNAGLSFVADGKTLRTLTKAVIRRAFPVETFTVSDAYYDGRPKTWRAVSLRPLLERGFEGRTVDLDAQQFILRCVDGYTVPLDGKRLLEAGGYLALADATVSEWDPIGVKKDNPGPYFVVWKHPDQQGLELHPRPYQLAAIELAAFETTFPHVAPTGEPTDSAAQRGFGIFKEQCIRCHAVNQEGGRVGPELNVPQSIVEYRSDAQLKAFIKNPRTFRYSLMPAHPDLRDTDLAELLAYFHAMKSRKHDPNAVKPARTRNAEKSL